MSFSDWLQDLILRSGHTRKEIAKLAGIPKNQMDGLCNRTEPNRFQIQRLTKVLNVNEDEIFCLIDCKTEVKLDPIKSHFKTNLPQKQTPNQLKSDYKTPLQPKNFKLVIPEKRHCRRCDRITNTECFRHAESRIIKFLVGGGIMADKIPDTLTGWMCFDCDAELSASLPKDATKEQEEKHAYEWLIVIAKTHLI